MKVLLFLIFLVPFFKAHVLTDNKNLEELISLFEKELKNNPFNFKIVYFNNTASEFTIQSHNSLLTFNDYFDYTKEKNIFLIHGWQTDIEKDIWVKELKNILLFNTNEKVNVFIVSWTKYSKKISYKTSVSASKNIAKDVAYFIEYIHLKYKIDLGKVYLIGHSLGAHISGQIGKILKKKNLVIGKITGLDPAGPLFQVQDKNQRLEKDDAKHVEVLHTNMGLSKILGLGTVLRSGHIDVFLNGGARQKGCRNLFKYTNYDDYYKNDEDDIQEINMPFTLSNENIIDNQLLNKRVTNFFFCDHSRAYNFYLDSIMEKNCELVAYKCNSYKNFLNGMCADCGQNNEKCALFSFYNLQDFNSSTDIDTDYFLETNDQKPFCVFHYQLKIKQNEKFIVNYVGSELIIEGNNLSENLKIDKFSFENSVFSTLFTTKNPLDKIIKIKLKNQNSIVNKENSMVEKVCPYENIEIVYMSSIDKNVRKSMSSKLCPVTYILDEIVFEEC